jgi:hypothetical protein
VLDDAGEPWIAYHGRDSRDLELARRRDGVWFLSNVVTQGDVGVGASLVLDSQDRPWVSWYDPTFLEFLVAHRNEDVVSAPPARSPVLRVGAPFPNPTRGPVSLAVDLPSASTVRLALLDVRGRVVARRNPIGVGPGATVLTWDPKPGIPGLYFLRIGTGERETTRKVVLVR